VKAAVEGGEPLEGKVNYFRENDTAKGESAIPIVGRIHIMNYYVGWPFRVATQPRELGGRYAIATFSKGMICLL
jgi:hypothetical protein